MPLACLGRALACLWLAHGCALAEFWHALACLGRVLACLGLAMGVPWPGHVQRWGSLLGSLYKKLSRWMSFVCDMGERPWFLVR